MFRALLSRCVHLLRARRETRLTNNLTLRLLREPAQRDLTWNMGEIRENPFIAYAPAMPRRRLVRVNGELERATLLFFAADW